MKLECLICGKNYSSLAHHLSLVHKVSKQEYISRFNLSKDFKFTSNEYTKKMSDTITNNFWNDSRKLEAKQRMINQWENEYLRNKRTKGNQTASLAAWRDEEYRKRVLSYRTTQYSIPVIYNTIKYRCQQEADIAKILDDLKIKFRYEDLVIPYYDKKGILRTHITDFYLPNYNLIIEAKSSKSNIGVNEKLKQKSAIDLGYKYIFITNKDLDKEIINRLITQ